MLSKELLEILACPRCKGDLVYDEKRDILICNACRVFYPIEEDIPILLIESAKPLEEPQEGYQAPPP
ncbi:MAG: Trm112 family protein [Aquificaceae bacterium]|nr:Trm112 family protein [Aquificaceae bacterium]